MTEHIDQLEEWLDTQLKKSKKAERKYERDAKKATDRTEECLSVRDMDWQTGKSQGYFDALEKIKEVKEGD